MPQYDFPVHTRSSEKVLEFAYRLYLSTVKPMHELYVEPSKRFADLIVPGQGRHDMAVELIAHWIEGA